MGNMIADLLAKASPMGQMMQQAAGMARNMQSGNPMGMLANSNPQMQQVYDFINQNGGNPEKAFYALAKQKGVDPNQILSQVRSMMGK